MPDHELARLSGDFSESRSWKKLSRFQVNLQLVRLLFLVGHLQAGFGTEAEVCYWISSRISLNCSIPPPKKNLEETEEAGEMARSGCLEIPGGHLGTNTPRSASPHTARFPLWVVAGLLWPRTSTSPARCSLDSTRSAALGLPVPAARCGTSPPPLLLFSLGEDAFSCCFRTHVRSKSTGGEVRALGSRERRFSRRGHKTRSENRGGNYSLLLCTRRPERGSPVSPAHLLSSERVHV